MNFKIQIAGAVGDCTGDTFTASSPSLGGSPVICGYNTGQHSKIHNTGCSISVYDTLKGWYDNNT